MKAWFFINILWLVLPQVGFSAQPDISSKPLLPSLRELQTNPQVAEALGKEGRLTEVVTHGAGVYVVYGLRDQACAGKTYYDADLKREMFEVAERCVPSVYNRAESTAVVNSVGATGVASQFQRMISAVSYVENYKNQISQFNNIARILGVRSEDGNRMIITYSRTGDAKTCSFAMEPMAQPTAAVPSPVRWRLTSLIACDSK